MKRSDFLQAIKEQQYHVPTGSVQPLFTGPITIRIHEADGTPYEHIVEIREDNSQNREVKFDIPYNTKYKRLKRRREKKQVAAGAAGEAGGVPEEGYIYSLGDTINTPADTERYVTEEYDEATEKRMDAESYEWLRIDTDFEWLCSMQVHMAAYMFVSQLQQDRDVVAQHDTMVYLENEIHPVSATVLVRTLMDIKYYHGIRTTAAQLLKDQCSEIMGMRGMVQLEMAFRDMFCFPGTTTPRPNDFSDKRQYLVQCAIPESLSMIRDGTGKCPMRVKRFILNILRLNNNNENPFSDDIYVATLIKSVANTLLVDKESASLEVNLGDGPREEEKQFETEALEEINRYLRRDEWTHSYRNVWTVAGLEAKRRLMKAGVIPVRALDFLKYL
jgi:transcription initiation factor TFIID subunit 2